MGQNKGSSKNTSIRHYQPRNNYGVGFGIFEIRFQIELKEKIFKGNTPIDHNQKNQFKRRCTQ